MRLYILRHAEAQPHAATDSARELTPRGLEQARTVGAYCQRQGLTPELILASPYRRTVQTADLVAAALAQSAATQIATFLASGMRPASALEELRAYQRFQAVMIVGHQPDLGDTAAMLLGLPDAETLPVGKASLIGLDVARLAAGGASLRFFLPVKMMV